MKGGAEEIQFYSFTGTEKYSVQFYWHGEIQCTVLLGRRNTVYSSTGTENTVYSSTGTEKGYTLTTFILFRAYQKRGYPLTTNHIAKLYLFVTDYNTIQIALNGLFNRV